MCAMTAREFHEKHYPFRNASNDTDTFAFAEAFAAYLASSRALEAAAQLSVNTELFRIFESEQDRYYGCGMERGQLERDFDFWKNGYLAGQKGVDGLREIFTEPHFLGAPMVGDPITSMIDPDTPPPHLSEDEVLVSRAWYERLKALILPAPPKESTR